MARISPGNGTETPENGVRTLETRCRNTGKTRWRHLKGGMEKPKNDVETPEVCWLVA